MLGAAAFVEAVVGDADYVDDEAPNVGEEVDVTADV